jgi:hypothetical protein
VISFHSKQYEPVMMKEIATEMESHLVILTAVLEDRVSQSFDHYLFTIISSWERAFVQVCCPASSKSSSSGAPALKLTCSLSLKLFFPRMRSVVPCVLLSSNRETKDIWNGFVIIMYDMMRENQVKHLFNVIQCVLINNDMLHEQNRSIDHQFFG